MKFDVLKEFTWNGQLLHRGDTLEISDESTKIGPLTRAKFIRFHDEDNPPVVLPNVEEVAQEIENEQQAETADTEELVEAGSPVAKDPREIVRQAKVKAASKK